MFRRLWFKALVLVLYALAFVSLGVYLHRTLGGAPPSTGSPPPAARGAGRATASDEDLFMRVAERVTPAVVNIRTTATQRRGPSPLTKHFGNDPRFRDFFDRFFEGSPDRRPQASLGTGVIIDKAGHILTNNHVIKDADQIVVKLASKEELKAKVVGSDPRSDVAVLKVQGAGDLPAAALGDSDRLRVGQWALAIGNPFGLEHSLAVGVVSATGRSEIGITALENFIQTDASINPGNSGGPLLNIQGEVIGINTAIVATGQGIGFAIPINLARKVAGQLIAKGRVARGWVGITLQRVTPDLARSLGLRGEGGAVVGQVMPRSPAEAAGLRSGDLIVALDGRRVADPQQAQQILADLDIGREVEVVLRRGQESRTVKLKVGEMPGG